MTAIERALWEAAGHNSKLSEMMMIAEECKSEREIKTKEEIDSIMAANLLDLVMMNKDILEEDSKKIYESRLHILQVKAEENARKAEAEKIKAEEKAEENARKAAINRQKHLYSYEMWGDYMMNCGIVFADSLEDAKQKIPADPCFPKVTVVEIGFHNDVVGIGQYIE